MANYCDACCENTLLCRTCRGQLLMACNENTTGTTLMFLCVHRTRRDWLWCRVRLEPCTNVGKNDGQRAGQDA